MKIDLLDASQLTNKNSDTELIVIVIVIVYQIVR